MNDIDRRASSDPDARPSQLSLEDAPEQQLRTRGVAVTRPTPVSTSRRASGHSRSGQRGSDVARLALCPDEAAIAIGVSRSFFFASILPNLKVVRVGRKRLVPVPELEAWLAREAAQIRES